MAGAHPSYAEPGGKGEKADSCGLCPTNEVPFRAGQAYGSEGPLIRPLRGHLLPVGEKRLALTPAISSPPGERSAERSGGWVRARHRHMRFPKAVYQIALARSAPR
ncbi:hypothetical protein MPLB_1570016 [Mesorhizobium sp. ORS 3324]|nr:hypothetical protein MPLB_1570016 [Mesorhizobium sp. ORS 3324]